MLEDTKKGRASLVGDKFSKENVFEVFTRLVF